MNGSEAMEEDLDPSNLIVNYLPASLDEAGFRSMFEQIGTLQACKLMRNKQGESLAFGFIHFASPEHGLKAIETYNGLQKEGKTMKVSIATPKHMRESRNLYISDLPEHVSELQLREVFEQYGHVFNCKLVINPETRKSRGFAFVLFSKASESEAAIQGLNSYRFSGAEKPMTVKVKDEPRSSNPHLYVANVPKNMDEDDLKAYFNAYGEIRNCKIVRDTNTGASKGVAFVHYARKKESDDAIFGLHDTRLPGSTQNLIVKFKDESKKLDTPATHNYGEYNPAWYGYGSMDDQSGWTQEETVRSPTGEVQHIIHHYVGVPQGSSPTSASPGFAPPGVATPEDAAERDNGGGPMRRAHAMNRYHPAAPPPPPPGTGPVRPLLPPRPTPMGSYSGLFAPKYTHEDAKKQPSHQLYVFGLGAAADELGLYDLFAPFGAITKVHVMRDKTSGEGKGFAFVEMPDYDAAILAIEALNGMPFKGNSMKPLKVDFKQQGKKK